MEMDERFVAICEAARTNKEVCPYGCGKLIAPRTIDYHRNHGCRNPNDEPFGDVARRRYFVCGACYSEFVTRAGFFEHLEVEHDVHPKVHDMSFDNYDEFERFLRWIEAEGGAHFRCKSGSKRRSSGRGIFMMCNRSGFISGTSMTGDPEKDRVGPFRIGYTCTAYIHGLVHPDGHVTINYCGDHYGHDARMRLPLTVKNIIMEKQLQGIPNQEIIKYLQHKFLPFAYENIYAQRICLVDQDELRQILVQTKKWEAKGGLPVITADVWEEELLEKAGIGLREGMQSKRRSNDRPTNELAALMRWPKPTVYTPKMRNANGQFVTLDGELAEPVEEDDAEVTIGRKVGGDDDEFYEVQPGNGGEYEQQQHSGAGEVKSGGEDLDESFVNVLDVEDAASSSASSAKRPKRAAASGGGSGGTSLVKAERAVVNGSTASGGIVHEVLAEIDLIRSAVNKRGLVTEDEDLAATLERLRRIRTALEGGEGVSKNDDNDSLNGDPLSKKKLVRQTPRIEVPYRRSHTRYRAPPAFTTYAPSLDAILPPVKPDHIEDEAVDQMSDDEFLIHNEEQPPTEQIQFKPNFWN